MRVGCRTLIAVSILVLTMVHDRVLQAQPNPAMAGGLKSGALFDELARMDSALFEASFVLCDADRAHAQLE